MFVRIDTTDPDAVNADDIADLLEAAGYFVTSVEVNDVGAPEAAMREGGK